MMQPGAPPGMGGPIAKGQKKKAGAYNLKDIVAKETLKKHFYLKPLNHCYHLYQITTMFAKKGLWVFSCMALMYGLPMMIEYMGEQNKIIMKIMASQDPNGMAMGPGR